MKTDIGINEKNRKAVAESLSQALADTYALYQKTHGYHWNVMGPRFGSLHLLFETQYNELWAAVDLIAERIRALGALVPTHADLANRAQIAGDNDPALTEDQMLVNLTTGNEELVKSCRATLKVAADAGDDSSEDLMVQRVTASEKAAWMLRSHLN
ncbi:MAG: DNA starvation/stationary phase protection protein [Caulobacterales bacterium]